MKRYLIFYSNIVLTILIVIFIQSKSNCQNWFEGTPNWHYRYEWNCINPKNGFDRISYQKDTLIEGTNMKLFKYHNLRNDSGYVIEYEEDLIMYEVDDRVYKYANGNHKKLYDFNHEIGDSIQIYISTDGLCDTMITFQLDTIEFTEQYYNIDSLRVQKWIKVNGQFDYDEFVIIEKIGAIGNFYFEISRNWNCGLDQCHPYYFECYYNPELDSSLYSETCIDFFTFTEEILYEESKITVFPNPTNDLLNIEGEFNFEEILIYDSKGALINKIRLNGENEVNINYLYPGLYYLKFISSDNKYLSKKIIKI